MLTKTTHVQKCVRGSPLLPQVLTHRQARTAQPAPTSLADGTTLGMGPTGMMGVRPGPGVLVVHAAVSVVSPLHPTTPRLSSHRWGRYCDSHSLRVATTQVGASHAGGYY